MIIVKLFLLIVHVFHSLDHFVDKVAFLQVFDDVWLRVVNDVAELFNCEHALRLPVVKLAIDLGEAGQFVTCIVKLGVACISMEIDFDAKLSVSLLEFVELIFHSHLIDSYILELLLFFKAEVSGPKH